MAGWITVVAAFGACSGSTEPLREVAIESDGSAATTDADAGVTARLVSSERVVDICILVADTAEERQRGLSRRTDLGPFDGMLFVFESAGVWPFWMKDTLIPLDLVPLGTAGELTSPIPMQPCPAGATCPTYPPEFAYTRALEFPAGRLDTLGVDAGAGGTVFELGTKPCPSG